MGSRRSAEDSITGLNGERIGGYRVTVELSNKKDDGKKDRGDRSVRDRDRSGRDRDRSRGDRDRNGSSRKERSKSRSRDRSRRKKNDERSRSPEHKRHKSKRSRSKDKKRRSSSKDSSRFKDDKRGRSVSNERLRSDSRETSMVKEERRERSASVDKIDAASTLNDSIENTNGDNDEGRKNKECNDQEMKSISDTKEEPFQDHQEDTTELDIESKADVNNSQDSGKDDLDITDARETFDD